MEWAANQNSQPQKSTGQRVPFPPCLPVHAPPQVIAMPLLFPRRLCLFSAPLLLAAHSLPLSQSAQAEPPLPADVTASDWPAWRGPTHDGQAPAGQTPPLAWSAEKNLRWSVEIPGRGSSSPTVVGRCVYLSSCDEGPGSQTVYAFDRETGKQLWQREVHASGAMRKNQRSTGASSTILGDGKALYAVFANSGAIFVTALSPAGEPLWQTKLTDYQIHQGYGASPFLYGDTILVAADTKGGGAVAAMERATGKIIWKRDRPSDPNYSSPVVYTIDGRDQLIMTGCNRIESYDPRTGETLWEKAGATTECVTTTVSDGTRVFSSGGYPRNHVAAMRADGSGTIEWENNQRVYVPSLLYRDGFLYAVLDAGIAICWNSATGEERWKERLGGNFSASPVMVGETIFVTSETGQTHIFQASPERFTEIAVNSLGDEVFSTPAFCGNEIFYRATFIENGARREKLFCIAAGTN